MGQLGGARARSTRMPAVCTQALPSYSFQCSSGTSSGDGALSIADVDRAVGALHELPRGVVPLSAGIKGPVNVTHNPRGPLSMANLLGRSATLGS